MDIIKFENVQVWFDQEDEDDNTPVLVACRDREDYSEERWVVASPTIDQAKEVRDYLNSIIKD